VKRAGALPPDARGPFVDGFKKAAKGGLEVGAGQTGAAQHLPRNLPQQVVDQITRAAQSVFTHGYVGAMKPTMLLPIVIVFIGAASCLAVRGLRGSTAERSPETVEATTG
jgi:hypothetical protein